MKNMIYSTLALGINFFDTQYANLFTRNDDNDNDTEYYYYDVNSDSFITVILDDDGYVTALNYND